MTADSYRFEHAFLSRVAIVNEVRQSSHSDPDLSQIGAQIGGHDLTSRNGAALPI
jgi:hypothetical protein